MGFELIRRMPVFSILPAHVAYQHHERQDGEGYPRGLIGNNVLGRSLSERMNPRRMLLIAEISAVADVYSALTSDRPYRPAMPLDKVDQIISEMSGAAPQRRGRPDAAAHHPDVPGRPLDRGPDRQVPGLARRRLRAVGGRAPSRRRSGCCWTIADDRVPTPVEVDLRRHDDVKIKGLAPGEAPFELGVAV